MSIEPDFRKQSIGVLQLRNYLEVAHPSLITCAQLRKFKVEITT